jgi:hypothetical protein
MVTQDEKEANPSKQFLERKSSYAASAALDRIEAKLIDAHVNGLQTEN